MGAGIALSIFQNSTPSTSIPRSHANRATSRALETISDNLEHCCKRSVRYGIQAALEVLQEILDLFFEFDPIPCSFSSLNPKCSGSLCTFFD